MAGGTIPGVDPESVLATLPNRGTRVRVEVFGGGSYRGLTLDPEEPEILKIGALDIHECEWRGPDGEVRTSSICRIAFGSIESLRVL